MRRAPPPRSRSTWSALARRLGLLAAACGAVAAALAGPTTAIADGFAGGYPEEVIQWGVQKGETCDDIAKALYGDAKYVYLLQRYNRIACTRGAPLKPDVTLVVPAKVTDLPAAQIGGLHPAVKAKPPGGGWSPASPGTPLPTNSNVSTEEGAQAEIKFIDRSRIFLSENTLVVIFGTASQSAVSKAPPSAIELDQGEVKAALSALGGADDGTDEAALRVAIAGGGHVAATSKDTVVDRKKDRTTVQVFDGRASVDNAGANVTVPTNFGTRFVAQKPPDPPRPLPPAPAWSAGTRSRVVLSPEGGALLTGGWEDVPKAATYRIEVAKDAEFGDLVAREVVPASVKSFRLENLSDGVYFVRVRAIDTEDYLGVATPPVKLALLTARVDGLGQISSPITANPYAHLRFAPVPKLQLKVGDGAFEPIPEDLDLAKARPSKLVFRLADDPSTETEVEIEYTHPTATMEWETKASAARVPVLVTITGTEGTTLRPRLRIHRGEEVEMVELDEDPSDPTGSKWKGMLNHPDDVSQAEVLDEDGVVLGHREFEYQPTKGPPRSTPDDRSNIGISAPPFSLAPVGAPLWWTPGADTTGSIGVVAAGDADGGPADITGRILSSGALGPVGFDLQLRADGFLGERLSDPSGWVGARLRLMGGKKGSIEIGPSVRVGFPITKYSRPTRLEGGFAIGSEMGKWTWLLNAGSRFQLEFDGLGAFTMPFEAVGGITYQVTSWLRVAAIVDGAVGLDSLSSPCAICEENGPIPLGGASLGAEAGTNIFGGAFGRFSPFGAAFGNMEAILTFGVRTDRAETPNSFSVR